MSSTDAAFLQAQTDGALAREVASVPSGTATAAEGELYRRFAPRVRLFGLKRLRDATAADDLAQRVMLVAIERLRAGEVRNPDQIGSFILGTSRMIAGGLRRTERRRQDLHVRFDLQEPVMAASGEWALDGERVGGCLAALRERERTILLLTFYAEKSSIEIGEALGITSGAVRVGRHRALASMRECLESRRRA